MKKRLYKFLKRLLWAVGVTLLSLLLLYLFRLPLFRAAGNYLDSEDSLSRSPAAQVVFVLSGSPLDRGAEAARVLKQGYAARAVCTGDIVPDVVEAAGLALTEGELTRRVIIRSGIDSSRIGLLPLGTSTYEEGQAIKAYCKANGLTRILILSNKHHTRRIRNVVRPLLAGSGVTFRLHGAPSLAYDETKWWKSEAGLIFVNNEYVKLLYYSIAH